MRLPGVVSLANHAKLRSVQRAAADFFQAFAQDREREESASERGPNVAHAHACVRFQLGASAGRRGFACEVIEPGLKQEPPTSSTMSLRI